MTEAGRCPHWNARGYGRCIHTAGHAPVDNGAGVRYLHEYNTHPTPSWGTFDVMEHAPLTG